MRRHTARVFLLAVLAMPAVVVAQSGSTSALIAEALDQPVSLDLNATLPRAMDAVADRTGVRVEAERAVWELLPWGDQTNVTMAVENVPLRAALDAIARKLGLVAVLTDQSVELRPLPPLRRLGRRATLDELAALDLLARTPFQPAPDSGQVRGLLAAVDAQLLAAGSAYAIENRAGVEANGRPVGVGRNATLLDALEALAGQTEATWYPWGKSVVVLPKDDQVRNQLGKRLTTRYSGVAVGQVLTELSQASGVEFTIEPGALQRIAPEGRTIKLLLDNASVEQALEHIAGFTGLGYVVNDRGVYFWNASTGTASPAAGRDPVVALVEVSPGVQVLVPQSQIPAEIRDRLRVMVMSRFDEMGRAANAPPATTAPSTRPAK